MHKVKTENVPAIFLPKFQKPAHPHPANFSKQLNRSKYLLEVQPFGRSF